MDSRIKLKENVYNQSTRYHKSNGDFLQHVKDDAKKLDLANDMRKLDDFEVIDYIVKNYAFYIEKIDDNRRMIWFYDYDQQKYILDNTLLFKAISKLAGKLISESRLTSFIKDLNDMNYSMKVRTLDDNELPMKNCIIDYNTLEEIEYSPDVFVSSRIDNEYKVINEHPKTLQNLNIFDIIKSAANDNKERYLGLLQVIRQALLKKNLKHSIILFIGPGGHGKSVIANFMSKLIGQTNITNITIDQFSNKDDVLSINNAHAVIGADIDDDVYIRNLKNLKAISAGDTITVSPKYEKASSILFTGPIIQLTSGLIKMNERNGQMRRRLKPYAFNRDFTKEENRIDEDQLSDFFNNKDVQQYFIYQLLNMEELQDKKDFIGWDKELLTESTELNDTTYVFQQYLRDKTNLLDMDKLPLGVLKAVYCDVLDLEEGSQASKISTREIVRRNKEFFKSYGYINEPGQRMTQKAAHNYITRDLIDLSDEEFDQYLSDAEKGKESDHDLIGEFTSRCLRENKTSAYLKKVSD